MKKAIFTLLLILVTSFSPISYAQTQTFKSTQIVEIVMMVDLSEWQTKQLMKFDSIYTRAIDSLYTANIQRKEIALLIRSAKRRFEEQFMGLLAQDQKNSYIRTRSTPEVMEKAAGRVVYLRETGRYTEQELESMQHEIFEYLMLEKLVYTSEKYNIIRQKENIAQLKQREPQSLRMANGLQKAKHQGVKYQQGYQW